MSDDCKHSLSGVVSDDRVLELLAERGDWLSGEELAEILGVSRAAVAKRVARLRRCGHVIEAQTNRGYRLLVLDAPVAFSAVEPHLKTKRLGKTGWRTLADTTSTNNEAILWALAGGPADAVVTAERQSMGKGRRGHVWFSAPRSLMFSFLLRPRDAADAERITKTVLAAMAAAIVRCGFLEPTRKQPNDLLLNGKKIAGVLVESGSRAGVPEWVAVGVGCNVNTLENEFPRELRRKTTSLYAATGKTVDRNLLLGVMLTHIERMLR